MAVHADDAGVRGSGPDLSYPYSTVAVDGISPVDVSELLYGRLRLSPDQKVKLEPAISAHLGRLKEIRQNASLTKQERRSRVVASWKQLEADIAPSLNHSQAAALSELVQEIEAKGGPVTLRTVVPLVAVEYRTYFPSDAAARAIFGDSTSSFSFGLGDFFRSPSKRYVAGFSLGSVSIENGTNKLFVLSPQFSVEYRVPIVGDLSTYAGISAGPAYMDYSYDTPGTPFFYGTHYGAKRLGAEGEFEVGLRYGRVQLAATYHAMTRPSNLAFDGLGVSLTWIAVRF